jgi:hypothetical protein
VALTDSADGWIAAHLAEGFDGLREQQRVHAHAGRSERRLGAGMTATHDYYVKRACRSHEIAASSKR